MNALPASWAMERLDGVAEVRLGRQRSPKNHSGSQMRAYLRAANVDWQGLQLDDVKTMNFTDAEMEIYRLEPGDLLLSEASGSPGEVGKPAIWSGEIEDCGFQNTLIRVRSRGPEPRYLMHFFRYQALAGRFADRSRGVGIHHLGRAALSAWAIPVPPLDEQRRIVDILEDHLSRVDAADALLSVNLARTTTFGSLACEAALRRAAKECGGALRSVGEVCEFVTDGDHNPPKRVPTGIPHVTAKGVHDGIIDLAGCTFIDESGFERTSKRYRPQAGDVLITCVGTIGRVAVVPPGITFSADRNLAGLRPRARLVAPEYLALAANSVTLQHAMRRASGSTAQPHLYLRDIRALLVPTPGLELQQELVRWVDDLSVARGRLRSGLELAQRRSTRLRRSLLQAAFSGRLTGRSSDLDVVEVSASV